MTLQTELDTLAARVASFSDPQPVDDATWQVFAEKAVVALMAGGESSRFSSVLAGQAVHKNAYELPNGDTMMEMTIRQYKRAGITKFVALVYHNADSIKELLGDGSKLGVQITYSHDPEHPVGKGGAVRNALDNGSIPEDAYLIVANPDDIIVDFPDFARYIGTAHLEGEAKGMLATPILTLGKNATYTGMMVVDNQVMDTQMYPYLPVPAHVGITVFSPAIFPKFRELFDLSKRTDFEQVLFPLLAAEKKLWSAGLTRGDWIQVNDLKSYKQLVEWLENNDPSKDF